MVIAITCSLRDVFGNRDFLEGLEGKRSARAHCPDREHGPTHDPFCLSSIPSRCLGVVGVEEVAAVEEEEVRCGVNGMPITVSQIQALIDRDCVPSLSGPGGGGGGPGKWFSTWN